MPISLAMEPWIIVHMYTYIDADPLSGAER